MDPNVTTAIITAGASMITGLGAYFAGIKRTKEARKQLNVDASGEHRIAELADSRQFRKDLSDELKDMRAESRALRDEIREQAEACELKIEAAVKRESEDCERRINSKLRRQAAMLRSEFASRPTAITESS